MAPSNFDLTNAIVLTDFWECVPLSNPAHKLFDASNSVQTLQDIRNSGANFNVVDSCKANLLHLAARRGQTKVLQYLLTIIPTDNEDIDKRTALHYASLHGHTGCVQMLIKEGNANIHAIDKDGSTPLQDAAVWQHTEGLKLLIAAGSDVNNMNFLGRTALHEAAGAGYLDIVRILLENGADINAVDNNNFSVLHSAAISEGSKDVIKLLIEYGANVNAMDKNAESVLHVAVGYSGDIDLVKILLSNGAKIPDGKLTCKALKVAIETEHMDTARLFFNLAKKTTGGDDWTQSVLEEAVKDKALNVIKMLLGLGVKVPQDGDPRHKRLFLSAYDSMNHDLVKTLYVNLFNIKKKS